MYSKLGRKITDEEFDIRIKDSNFIRVGSYINSKTPIYFKCKECGKETKIAPKSFNTLKCNCQTHKNTYINNIKSKNIELLEPYVNMRTKINHRCNNCNNIFNTTPKSVNNSVNGCPSCSGKIFSTDKYKSLLPNDIILISDIYTGSNKILTHKCLKCEYIWDTKPNYIIHTKCGCPRCALSKGEREIYNFLDTKNIKYTHQYKVNINNKNYKFDFYLKDYDIFIEYDGIQHFQPVKYFGGDEQYEIIKKNDDVKNKWISSNKKNLLRISYLDNVIQILEPYLNNKKIINEKKIMSFKLFNNK